MPETEAPSFRLLNPIHQVFPQILQLAMIGVKESRTFLIQIFDMAQSTCPQRSFQLKQTTRLQRMCMCMQNIP
jgi:hypothetical protein